MNGLCIPNRLRPLVAELAAIHYTEQLHQLRRMGPDHPQARKAREHVEQARDLLHVVGISTEIAA